MAKLEIMNNGLGPAFIKKFQIYLNQEPCNYDVALNYVANDIHCTWQRTKLGEGYVMKSGEVKEIFNVVFPCNNNEELALTKAKFNVIDLAIEYECAYGRPKKFDTFEKQG